MPKKNPIQWQREILQLSHAIINDYERGKSNAEMRLKRDKETAKSTRKHDTEAAERAWKRDEEPIEQILSRTKTQADSAIRSVREAMESAQQVLKGTEWQQVLKEAEQQD